MENKIVRKIDIKAPVTKVWEALTDHKKFGEWFKVNIQSPFEIGKVSLGQMTYPGYEDLKWEAIVQKMETNKLFSFTWPPGAEPGDDESTDNWTLVEFHLEETAEGTRLTLVESGFDRVPENRRAVAFRENSGGWDIQTQNIKNYVEQ